ncbi:MAG TPA: hypothetical protein VGF13_18260 [Verrucomicrobiae bacterium]|jgi:hypothetical protein
MDTDRGAESFNPAIRYLLSTHRRECLVTERGVTFRLNGRAYNYRGAQLAHLNGQRVLVWFNVQNPEIATITDLQRTSASAIQVELSQQPNAFEQFTGIGAGTLAHELAKVEGQVSVIKARYHAIKSKYSIPRPQLLDTSHEGTREAIALGQRIEQQQRTILDGKRYREKAHRVAAHHDIAFPSNARPGEETADAIAKIASYLPEQTDPPGATVPKTYVLKEPPAATAIVRDVKKESNE